MQVPNPEIARSLRIFSYAGCLDMVAVEGQFTFTADRPQLSCAAFFMAEPNEVITVEYDGVDVDCSAGDFITVSHRRAIDNQSNITWTFVGSRAETQPSLLNSGLCAKCNDNYKKTLV